MGQPKMGKSKKGRQTSHNKTYYEQFARRHASKLIRRRAKRELNVEFFIANPKAGSPSQVRNRRRFKRLKEKKHANQTGDGRSSARGSGS